jgi:predicted PurR-regulated permease PerM
VKSKPDREKQILPPTDQGGRRIARVLFATAFSLLTIWVASDFIAPLAWAVVLAVTSWPAYSRFQSMIPKSSLALALLFTCLIGIVLFIPIAVAVHQLAQQSAAFAQWITEHRERGLPVPAWLSQLPVAGEYVRNWWAANLADPNSAWLATLNADQITGWAKLIGGQVVHRVFLFFVSLVALFFFFRHGAFLATRTLEFVDRLLGDPGERLASKMVEAVRGAVTGILSLAFGEGILIGSSYFLAGVPNPLLLTFLTMVFAMVPMGAWVVFTLAAALLGFGDGNAYVAGGVFAWGAIVMLVGDYVVGPRLIGHEARLPFLLSFIGIFGGLSTFGLIGLFLGPVVMAGVLVIWREWVGIERSKSSR